MNETRTVKLVVGVSIAAVSVFAVIMFSTSKISQDRRHGEEDKARTEYIRRLEGRLYSARKRARELRFEDADSTLREATSILVEAGNLVTEEMEEMFVETKKEIDELRRAPPGDAIPGPTKVTGGGEESLHTKDSWKCTDCGRKFELTVTEATAMLRSGRHEIVCPYCGEGGADRDGELELMGDRP